MNTVKKLRLERMLQLCFCYKLNFFCKMHSQMAHLVECIVDVINKHPITLVCPQGRNKRQVTSQLSSCMRSCKLSQISGQSQIVFWIEDM